MKQTDYKQSFILLAKLIDLLTNPAASQERRSNALRAAYQFKGLILECPDQYNLGCFKNSMEVIGYDIKPFLNCIGDD